MDDLFAQARSSGVHIRRLPLLKAGFGVGAQAKGAKL